MTQEQGAQIEVVEEAQAPTKALKTAGEAPPSEGAATADAPAENGASQNGHSGDHAGSESEEVADAQSASAGEPAEEELWRRRLWFVRIPRPQGAEVGAVKPLDQELETYKIKYKLLSEAFNVKKVERDAARENTRVAREAFKACREAYEAKRAVVQPMRDAAASTSEEAKKLREQFSELDVRTEAELDAKLQEMHYRIEHESIPLNEEKRLLQQIKKLESQRAKVREYEMLAGSLAESRTEVRRLEGELAEHRAELTALLGEKNTQYTILEKFREQEQALDKEVEDILTERKRIKEIQDEAYQRVSEVKSTHKAKNDEFYNNRRFSRQIRELVAAGKLEEARELCSAQMEEAHAKLSSDGDYRAEYFALWEQQRKSPVSMAAVDDDADLAPAKGGRRQQQQQKQQPAVEPAKKAEQVIAAVLEEAKGEIMRVKAAAASAAVAAAAASPGPAVAEQPQASAAAEAEPAKLAKAVRPKKEAPKPAVELPVLPPDNFELPDVIKAAKKSPSAAELKAAEQERQRVAQLEAERRKQNELKRQQEREKKRQRALAEQQAAAAAAAAAAKLKQVPSSSALEAEAVPEEAGEEPVAVPSDAEQAPEVPAVQPTAAGKAAKAKPTKLTALTGKPKPTARRPATVKKQPLTKQIRTWVKENQVLLVVAVVVLIFLILAIIMAMPV